MPRIVLLAGPNGAGKSTIARHVLRDTLSVSEFVNADTIAAGLSGFAPDAVSFTAGRIMLDRIHTLSGAGADFAFESTLSSRSFAPFLVRHRDRGYLIHIVYVWLSSADLAVARVDLRVRLGGHGIAERDIRRRYARSLDNFFNLYRPLADSWIMLDNSTEGPRTAIAWRNVGGPIHVRRDGPWMELRKAYERNLNAPG